MHEAAAEPFRDVCAPARACLASATYRRVTTFATRSVLTLAGKSARSETGRPLRSLH